MERENASRQIDVNGQCMDTGRTTDGRPVRRPENVMPLPLVVGGGI